MEDSVDKISLQKENIRLEQENISLCDENQYLKMLLDRLIPVPMNIEVNCLADQYTELDNRSRKMENQGNKENKAWCKGKNMKKQYKK